MDWIPFTDWFGDHLDALLRLLATAVIGIPVVLLLARLLRKTVEKRTTEQTTMLIVKMTRYVGFAIIASMFLRELGFQLTTLLGAAGVVGVALGFASQTSVSNLISGVFLVLEKPFQIGDWVKLGEYSGLILSIDMLAIKVRTFDNTVIRIPNEMVIKTPVTNVTAYPVRRMDLTITVAYKEDIPAVMKLLREVAAAIPLCLDEPEPIVLIRGFGELGPEFLFGVWFTKEDFVAVRNAVLPAVKQKFDDNGIEIPLPHRIMYTGTETAPFPIQLVGRSESAEI